MSYNLCDECIAKTGPFTLSEYQSENNAYCHGCHQGRPTKSVVGRRETCTNFRRCRGQTPVFPPEKYDEYTTGWSELRHEPYDPDFPIPPIWIHCPACRAKEKDAEVILKELMDIKPHKVPFDPPGGPPEGVAHPEDDAVFSQMPDVVVEQGPNTNGDVFPKVTEKMLPPVYSTHAAKKLRRELDEAREAMEEKIIVEARDAMDEQVLAGLGVKKEDLEKYGPSTMTRADRAQRIQDLTDLSFKPTYVMSTLDPKSVRAAVLGFRPKEEIGDAVVNVPAVERVRSGERYFKTEPEYIGALTPEKMLASADHTRKVGQVWASLPEATMAKIGFGRSTGWDANGSPVEEWP